jgi:hypothetical protein
MAIADMLVEVSSAFGARSTCVSLSAILVEVTARR